VVCSCRITCPAVRVTVAFTHGGNSRLMFMRAWILRRGYVQYMKVAQSLSSQSQCSCYQGKN
jgi:hypothetical protein